MKQHDPFQQYVEKEKTRELFLKATRNGGTVADWWRQVLIAVIFVSAVGGVFFSRTQRFKAVLDSLTQDPRSHKAALAPKAAKPRTQETQSGGNEVMPSGISGDPDSDGAEELQAAAKSRAALGARLEAFAEGKAAAPTAAQVEAAMTGKEYSPAADRAPPAGPSPAPSLVPHTANPAPVPREEGAATPGANPAERAPASAASAPAASSPDPALPTAQFVAPAGAAYRPVQQIPAAYSREKGEFPDFP